MKLYAILIVAVIAVGAAVNWIVYDGDWRCMIAECRIVKK
jgi:uncharacterized membrane protein